MGRVVSTQSTWGHHKISTSEQHHFSHILTFHILWLAATARTVAPATAMAAATLVLRVMNRTEVGEVDLCLDFLSTGLTAGQRIVLSGGFRRHVGVKNLRVDYILNRTQYIISITEK